MNRDPDYNNITYTLPKYQKRLAFRASIVSSARMNSRLSVLFRAPFLAIALFAFVSPSMAEDNVPTQVLPEGNDDADETNDDNKKDSSHKHGAMPRVTLNGVRLPDSDSSLSLSLETSPLESESVTVTGQELPAVQFPASPEVERTRINSGKKTSIVRPDEFPNMVNNEYREAFARTPGILISEENTSPIINIGYRGLDSQRSEFSQVLKDGVSIKNEQFGFPETHYTPPLDAVDHIEVIRGGAALQFGPQPGGAINFVTRMPRVDQPFHFTTKDVFGSDELFTSYNAVDGAAGPFGYYAYYTHREREGFREANSDYDLDEGSAKLVCDPWRDSRFILTFDGYEEEHGEPGGLTVIPGPDAVLYQDDREATSRFFDRFRLQRYYGTLAYQKDFSDRTQLDVKAFGGYLSRFSKRQRGGGFGTLPTGAAADTNSIQLREDWTEGVELRLRHDYELAGDVSTFAGGLYFYHAVQDRHDERGATPDAESGQLRNFNVGETFDGAIFAENRFHFGRLSITPGMRLEHLQQSVDEQFNFAKTDAGEALASRSDFSFVPLFGVGFAYVLVPVEQAVTSTSVADAGKGAERKDTEAVRSESLGLAGPPRAELYANISQAYRPRTYGELVPTGPSSIVNGDLEEGHSLHYELGVRGKPLPFLNFDVSGFYYTFEDQVGDISLPGGLTSTGNVGDARYAGAEAALELDILSMANGGAQSPYGSLLLYANVTWLDAEFTSGPFDGFTPTYAPDYQVKAGVLYRWKNLFKAGLIGTSVDNSFADSNNTRERFIPAYMVWDLTAEMKFLSGRVGVIAGIKNLFDEDYWAEARDEGIVPAYGRNYYAGVSIEW
jgi:Fe(3+) dicitrate transport protein